MELCDAYEYPIVSFVDNPGFMVGPQAEREGIARHHARPLAALHPSHRARVLGADQEGLRARSVCDVGLGLGEAGAGNAAGVAVGGVGRHVPGGRRIPW